MITIKAFDKGLVCKGFQYEVGKTYEIPKEQVKICEYGFHASANFDISETVDYYPVSESTEYALVDINVVDKYNDKAVGDKIKVIRKVETLDELIKYDKTGEWVYNYAEDIPNANIKKLQNAVIEKEAKWCYWFARYIPDADIKKLQNAVIKKDKDGRWIYRFAKDIKGADIKKLQNVVIEKDKTGEWCYYFAKTIPNVDIQKLENAIIKKDKKGKWTYYFAKDTENTIVKKLQNIVIQEDKTGKWYARFIKMLDEISF